MEEETYEEIYNGVKIYKKPDLVGGYYYHAPDLTTVKATVNFTPTLNMMRRFIDEELSDI